MSIPDETRRQLVLMNEGQLLAHAGHQGVANAAELARCVIDGSFNALMALENRQDAAKFAFAMADRVAGGLKEPTPTPWLPEPAPPAPEIKPTVRERFRAMLDVPPKRVWLLYVPYAMVAGIVLGAFLMKLLK